MMLAHARGASAKEVSGSEGAYNRAQHRARRQELAGVWAGLILAGAAPAVSLAGAAAEGEAQRRAA
jgi:hypothetical protein